MGNKFSRRREAPVSSAASVASEQKPAVEHSTPTSDSGMKQEVVRAEDLDVLAEEPPKDECVPEVKEEEDEQSELLAKETQAPAQPKPLFLNANILEPESFAQPKPKATEEAEAQVALNPTPEDISEQNSALQSEADTEPISEPVPTPAEAVVEHKDQEYLTDPVLSSPPLIDYNVPDVISSPTIIPLDPDESSNISASEHHSTVEPEEFNSDFLEKMTGVEAEECLKMTGSEVNAENVSKLLKNSELKENDLLSDIIAREVKIPDDTPITDMSTSMELM
ncbi:proline-rich transmembrane protein 2-like [Girardinichthys multiradiatus]|uniref:proline-rich transmembrane protein 2-like n=1 Tax=Girardinichthys multiradiatus TaxID=208333 RepID=UPI001FADE935|nr:proline-rich transmembrane protein 2-like [Girardinichthys multiradiatus]